jgi:hypothetical protein
VAALFNLYKNTRTQCPRRSSTPRCRVETTSA